MRSVQQKQKESQGEFEELKEEIQTLNTQNYHSPALRANYKRIAKSYVDKYKIGLVSRVDQETLCYASIAKSYPQSQGKIIKVGSVTFRSNFECGSIGTVELIGSNVYKIGLDPQSNSSRGNTWFYFTVEGAKGQSQFIIEGFTKKTSLYNNGMKVCYRDMKQISKWRRGCTQVRYLSADDDEDSPKTYQLRFNYFFKSNQSSLVQFAYSFPYGLSKLQNLISHIQPKIRYQVLGRSYEGRDIPLITIGNSKSKETIILSSRVHPGQTCASYIIEGLIKQLISDHQHAKYMRERYIFKIIPMINVDGVIHGNYRFSASGVDLNRKWKQPSQQYQPQIYYLKEMILRQKKERKIVMYIDMHGHSRKKNVFFYGCSKASNSTQQNDYSKSKAFPFLMSQIHDAFNYYDCSFNVQKEKQGTARVSMWKELGIYQIFTLQSSMCGSQTGNNYLESDFQKIGRKLFQGIAIYFTQPAENLTPAMMKISNLKQKIIQTFFSDPLLLKIGSEQNSGSESQPEKGQNFVSIKSKEQISVKTKLKSYHSNLKHQKINNLKQKSETAILQNRQFVRQKQLLQFFFESPSETLNNNRNTPSVYKNKRVSSLSRNNNYKPTIKSITYNEQQNDQQKTLEKNKANLLIGSEGAQYRRIRKLAEQNWTKQSDIEVKGLRNKKVQMNNSKNLIPKLALGNHIKHRRTSAQMFFKKALKPDQKFEPTIFSHINVLCRGRQIHF